MAIFDELKSIAGTLREADKIPQYEQILGIQEKLLEMQNHIMKLNAENKELKTKLERKESLTFENNAYWIVFDDFKDGPFCSRCWDVQQNTVRLKPGVNNKAFHSCPECNGQFQTDPHFRPAFTSRRPPESFL